MGVGGDRVIGVILCMGLAILPAGAVERPTYVVSALLSWQTSRLAPARQAEAKREVSAIWARLGVDVQWRAPRAGETHVTVIVVDEAPQAGSVARLGWVSFVETEPTAVLYASASVALDMAKTGRTDAHRFADEPPAVQNVLAARLLGRAVAHELGHYLLGMHGHSERGLMRARIYAAESLSERPAAYGLTAAERQTLQRRMALLDLYARNDAPGASGS